MKRYLLSGCICLFTMTLIAQPKQVAITIDDIPNVGLYAQDSFRLVLLEYLEEKQIPAAIFVNESRLFQNEHYSRNFDIYLRWLKSPGLTVGNHTYEHLNYSDTTFAAFQADILKGEAIAAPLLKAQDRELKYFRFPFNSLGEDSLAHAQIMDFLHRQGYQLAPHTISSEDWMYNALYENFLAEGQEKRADSVGQAYVRQTMKLFAHYGQMSEELYDRQIRQIYLCHDNALNRDYLPQLLDSLQEKQYELISMEEALQDEVYQSEDYYFGRWGFSWVYRWLEDSDERQKMLRAEPFDQVIYQQYQALTQP